MDTEKLDLEVILALIVDVDHPDAKKAAKLIEDDLRITDYLDNDGVKCMFCGSPNLFPSPLRTDDFGDGVVQPVRCEDCGEEWVDRFRLSDVYFDV